MNIELLHRKETYADTLNVIVSYDYNALTECEDDWLDTQL